MRLNSMKHSHKKNRECLLQMMNDGVHPQIDDVVQIENSFGEKTFFVWTRYGWVDVILHYEYANFPNFLV